jgi:hypothetical protein
MARLGATKAGEIVDLLEKGKSRAWLTREFGITPSGVYYHALKAGLTSGTARGVTNPFRPEEDVILTRLRLEGATIRKIASVLGRPVSSVYMRLQILASRDDQDPVAA